MSRPVDRLPAPPLGIQPIGLLDFLQLKNGGKYPQILESVLLPTWDLREHYVATNAVSTNGAAIYSAVTGTFTQLIAPVTNWRYVWGSTLKWAPIGATDTFYGQLILRRNSDFFLELPYPNDNDRNVTGGQATSSRTVDFPAAAALVPYYRGFNPFWVPPSFAIGVLTFSAVNAGGTTTLDLLARLIELRG